MAKKRVLIIYYSHSSQTRNLITSFYEGLIRKDIDVDVKQLEPIEKLSFPVGSVVTTFLMMVTTFFRKRNAIQKVDINPDAYDLTVLAGPTWSYSPSGPILSFLDEYGELLDGVAVLPFISCRGYWRVHYYGLKRSLKAKGAKVLKPIVFLHVGPEPWRTIGVFLKLSGKVPESGKSWMRKYYRKFGHTKQQVAHAVTLGEEVGTKLYKDKELEDMHLNPIGDLK